MKFLLGTFLSAVCLYCSRAVHFSDVESVGYDYFRIPFRVNTRLLDDTIGTFKADRIIACARLCFSFVLCKSVDYLAMNYTCKLNSVDSFSPNLAMFEDYARSIHSDIGDWPMEIAGGCYQHNCSSDKMCFPIASEFTCIPIDCGTPPEVELVVINVTSTLFGNNEAVKCEPGYTLHGPNTIRCKADGQWTEPPYCLPVNCGVPSIRNGFANYESTTYGNLATVFCDYGFLVNGTGVIECQADGFWSDEECVVADCGDPAVDNSIYVGDNTSFGAHVDVICDVGYILDGMRTIRCLADGNWSTKPQCAIVDCGIPDVTYGVLEGTLTTYNSNMNISCIENYILIGNNVTVCQESGLWTSLPYCIPVICVGDVCFRAFSGIVLTFYNAFNYQFTTAATMETCVQYCGTYLPGYRGINYNPLDDFCRCLSVTFEEYTNTGKTYGTGSNYDLYEPFSVL